MKRGLLIKAAYDVWPITLVFAGALAAVECLLAYVIPTVFLEQGEQLLQLVWVQRVVSALLGAELGDEMRPSGLRSLVWAHPIVLATVWAQEITFCTRMPAGEIDRGTVDVLLGLPVSRFQVYLCETFVWITSGVILLAAALLGNQIGGVLGAPEFRGLSADAPAILVNLFCMYLAVGAMALLVSVLSDRRGAAVGVALGVVLASFFLSFLAQFWPVAERLSILSIMHYYRPLQIVQSQSWPLADMTVLVAAALTLWTLGAVTFVRRDIRTV